MKSVSVLQIGDIHYPENSGSIGADVKDFSLPAITAGAASNTLQVVFREISHIITRRPPASILVCGDLTSSGNISQYQECVKYLISSLDLHSRSKESIHVVPGNHDIDRTLCSDHEKLNLKKFEPLLKAWDLLTKEVLLTSGIRSKIFHVGGCNLNVLSMNSCMGCGEWHLVPKEVRTSIASLIESTRTSDPERAFDLEGNQIDTPMFLHDDIVKLNQTIQELSTDCIPFVLAHHNLLPQELLRVELYTELINSGAFRSTIAAICRPIVYCHGHIHSDPIEIVSNGRREGSQLICISAPQITVGFNELIAYYSSESKPLGLEVVMHRISPGGIMLEQSRHRIPFTNRTSFLSEEMETLQKCITQDPMKFNTMKLLYEEASSSKTENDTFAGLLQEASWFGIVDIDQDQLEEKYWRIRRRLA